MVDPDDGPPRRWRVALLADEARMDALVAFVQRHRSGVRDWALVAPACLAGAVRNATGLRVRAVLPAAQGGTLQIGAEVAAGELDALVFLRDPLAAPPHQSEGVALLRIADLHNVAVATNLAGAECLVRALCAEPALSARG